MFKKKFVVVFIAMVAIFTGYNVYQSRDVVIPISDLILANVEALAETPDEYTERTGCVAVQVDNKCTDKDGHLHSFSQPRE